MPVRLVPIRWFHLRRLRRWRGIPNHLRHPGIPSWPHHLRWWWRTKHDPTLWMRAVVNADTGELWGSAGLTGMWCGRGERLATDGYGEVSVLCVRDTTEGAVEDFACETEAVGLVLHEAPGQGAWAIVYPWADKERRKVFASQMAKMAVSTPLMEVAGSSQFTYTRDA